MMETILILTNRDFNEQFYTMTKNFIDDYKRLVYELIKQKFPDKNTELKDLKIVCKCLSPKV